MCESPSPASTPDSHVARCPMSPTQSQHFFERLARIHLMAAIPLLTVVFASTEDHVIVDVTPDVSFCDTSDTPTVHGCELSSASKSSVTEIDSLYLSSKLKGQRLRFAALATVTTDKPPDHIGWMLRGLWRLFGVSLGSRKRFFCPSFICKRIACCLDVCVSPAMLDLLSRPMPPDDSTESRCCC